MKRSAVVLALILFATFISCNVNGQFHKMKMNPGWINITELSYGLGINSDNAENKYDNNLKGINTVFAYQFEKCFSTGIGAGIFIYQGKSLVPLYLSERYNFAFPSKKIIPYINADGGLLISSGDFSDNSRLFINPSIGARYESSDKIAFTLSAGVLSQKLLKGSRDSFINLKAGVNFKL